MKRSAPARVLVLAGLDPSGRSSLLADGEAVRATGAAPVLCATSVIAHSAKRLLAVQPIEPRALRAQIEAALEDGPVGAVKIGAVGSSAALPVVAEILGRPLAKVPLVFQPVLESPKGGRLFDGDPEELLPLVERAALVAPDLTGAANLSGMQKVADEAAMYEAASRIALRGAAAVLVRGAQLKGAPADLLLHQGEVHWFRAEQKRAELRGAGCRLTSAIAAGLAQGHALPLCVERAEAYVRECVS